MLKLTFALLFIYLHAFNYAQATSVVDAGLDKWDSEEDLALAHGEDVTVTEYVLPKNVEEDLDDDPESADAPKPVLIDIKNVEEDLDDDIRGSVNIPIMPDPKDVEEDLDDDATGGIAIPIMPDPKNVEEDLDDDVTGGVAIPIMPDPKNVEEDLDDDVTGGSAVIPTMPDPKDVEEDLDDDATGKLAKLPINTGEEPLINGEHVIGENGEHVIGENGETGLHNATIRLDGDDAGNGEESGESEVGPSIDITNDGDNGTGITAPVEVLSTSNAEDKACVEDVNCKRNVQYCDGLGCCWWKVCKGDECAVNKQC